MPQEQGQFPPSSPMNDIFDPAYGTGETPSPRPRFPRGTLRGIIICLCTVLFLGLLALILFLVLVVKQRDVDYKLVSTEADMSRLDYGNWGMSIPINIVVAFLNDNFYDIRLVSFDLTGTHPLYDGVLVYGNMTNVVLPARTDEKLVSSVVYVQYLFSSDPSRTYVNALNQNCSRTDGVVWFHGDVHVKYDTFIKDGFLDFSSGFEISCATLTNGLGLNQTLP